MNMNQDKEKSGLFEHLVVLIKWRRFIVLNILGITLTAVLVSFLLPRWYKSSVTILPPKNPNALSAFGLSSSAIARQFNPLRSLGSIGTSQDMYNYLAILKSQTLMESVVRKFDLVTVYGVTRGSLAEAIEELKSNVEFRVNEEGTLLIEVSDKDAKQAADMAASFVTLLDELNRDLSAREARSNREFIELRVNQNMADLSTAENELKVFQEKYGFVAIPEQALTSVSAVGELYAQKELKALEVNVLRRMVGEDNHEYLAAKLQLSELEKKLKNVPQLGMEYLRLYREYLIQQKLYETLLPLLEQAKIEERRDTPTLLVLDQPTVAEKPYKPQKRIIVGVFFLISMITSIAVAFLFERIDSFRLSQPSEYRDIIDEWRKIFRRK